MQKMTEKFFDPLSVSQANMVPFILYRMQLFGITVDELGEMYDEWMAAKRKELQKQTRFIEFKVHESMPKPAYTGSLNKCKKCGSQVRRYRVNISRCTKVGGNYKTAVQCINKNCLHTEYK